ncbi:MAG: hypothetical protein BRC23_01800 [Parcubacteria group bacterium SW_4_49_11]|nr:MAG: hypothetical protein BRC23_01800 [Parcubacteria group bacterium SW_4_49_11]
MFFGGVFRPVPWHVACRRMRVLAKGFALVLPFSGMAEGYILGGIIFLGIPLLAFRTTYDFIRKLARDHTDEDIGPLKRILLMVAIFVLGAAVSSAQMAITGEFPENSDRLESYIPNEVKGV